MSGPETAGSGGQQGWSAPVAGLRGRLVASSTIASDQPFAIDLELENTSTHPVRVTLGDPFAITATLEDAGGQAVPPTGSRLEVLASSETVELAPRARRRDAVTARNEDAAASIDLTTVFWKLAPGHYRLSARWSSHAPGGWNGELALLPLELERR